MSAKIFRWVDECGNNYTSEQAAALVNKATGSCYTARSFELSHPIGSIYNNGTLWFQRLA